MQPRLGDGALNLAELNDDGLLTLELSPVALGIWSPGRVRKALEESLSFVRRIEESVDTDSERISALDLARDASLVRSR